MGVRAYGRETLASLPIDVDKNWNDRSISNINSLQVNEHITVTARGKKRNVYPALNRYDSETDGWYISKDNNDIERKFFKDDFSVDSSSQYTGDVADFTWDTANNLVKTVAGSGKRLFKKSLNFYGYREFTHWSSTQSEMTYGYLFLYPANVHNSNNYIRIYPFPSEGTGYKNISCDIRVNGKGIYSQNISSSGMLKTDPHRFGIEVLNNAVKFYVDGVLKATYTGSEHLSIFNQGVIYTGIRLDNNSTTKTAELYVTDLVDAPSISYADDFTTDTVSGANGRYQAVEGTVAYDDVNKRMTITAGAGVTAKTRLKSYTQLEGAYKRKLHLPATGTDGDVVAAYFGTEPTLESGFGIGAIRAAGAWNIATIDGATVMDTGTVIADLVDGDSFYVEVERDTTHGVVWYYVYKSGKPTTASGKLFNTYQEIYDGFWFKNNGAAENSIAVSEIEDRAESIVGRTNVQVEEPFWFRDEFSEDSRGRLVNGTNMFSYDAVNDQIVKNRSASAYYPETLDCTSLTMEYVTPSDPLTGNMTLMINDSPPSILPTSGTQVNGYAIYFRNSQGQIVFSRYINGVSQSPQSLLREFVADEVLTVKFTKTDTTATVVISNSGGVLGTLTLDTNAALTNGKVRFVNIVAGSCGVRSIEFSGTRVYNKPIHRGAMLETYHDGTQEVIGTTYINDMNWDTGELTLDITSGGSWAIDTVNGVLSVTTVGARAGVSFRAVQIVDGYWRFRFNTTSRTFQFGILQQNQITSSSGTTSIHNGGGYIVNLSTNATRLYTSMFTDLGKTTVTYVPGTTYLCEVLKVGNVITLKLTDPDGVIQTATWTDANNLFTTSIGVCNFFQHYPATTTKIWDLVAIGFESTSTNGIAACIPPIGGGARYGEQEKVYKQLVNAAKFGEYKTTASIKTSNADAEAIEMYFKNITDTTNVATDNTDTLAISLSDTNYATSTKDLQLLHGDRNDTIEVAVRKTSTATEVSPACYVTDLMILPKVEG